jgi:CRP-like cAMP-binding protein
MDSKLATIKSALSKVTSDRNSSDVKVITALISNVKFFESLKHFKSILKEVCFHLTYEFFEKGRYIFREGEFGDKFFIIIKGEAGVQVTIKEKGENLLKEVLIYRDGAGFGELALTDRRPRSATIITKSDCHLAVLDKLSYNRILASLLKQKRIELIDFLQTHVLFKSWTKGSILKISYCFEEKSFKKGNVVYKEGQLMENIFLIREGEVKISKNIKISIIDQNEPITKGTIHLKKYYNHKADMSIISQGEFVGINDLDNSNYTSTCTCISNEAKMFMISKEDFSKRLTNEESQEIIKTDKTLRNSIHEHSIQSITKIIKDRIASPYKRLFLEETLGEKNVLARKINDTGRYSSEKHKKPLISQDPKKKTVKNLSNDEDMLVSFTFDNSFKKENRENSFTNDGECVNSQRICTSVPKSRPAYCHIRPTSCCAGGEFQSNNQRCYRKSLKKNQKMMGKLEECESQSLNISYAQRRKEKKNEMLKLLLAQMQPLGRSKTKKTDSKSGEEVINIHVLKKNKMFRNSNPTNWSFRYNKNSPKSFMISQDVIQ